MKQSSQMKVISPNAKLIHNQVKLIFLNPYHYTYVLQKQDNFIYLFDEFTSSMVGKSKVLFTQNFKMLAFTDNFNIFCSYVESKSKQTQAQIIIFNLELDGSISHHRYPLTRNKISQNLLLFNIAFLEKQQLIVGLGKNKIYFINVRGQVIKELQIKHGNRELNLIKGNPIRNNKWIFIQEHNTTYFVTITFQNYFIEEIFSLPNKITSIYLDPSIRCQFMAFIMQLKGIIILVKIQQRWHICHRFQIPNLFLRKLCFVYPGVNTSTVNKFKDKIFLLIDGDKDQTYDPKSIDLRQFQQMQVLPKFPIPEPFISQKMIYFHQYSIKELKNYHLNHSKVKPQNMFCMKDSGIKKYSIWANEHEQNHIRSFNQDKTIRTVDITSLLPGESIGQEWVNLGYQFEARNSNVLYEETEDNFQKEKVQYRTISEQELNDWSYSLFSKDMIMRKTLKRINCINFD